MLGGTGGLHGITFSSIVLLCCVAFALKKWQPEFEFQGGGGGGGKGGQDDMYS